MIIIASHTILDFIKSFNPAIHMDCVILCNLSFFVIRSEILLYHRRARVRIYYKYFIKILEEKFWILYNVAGTEY